MLDPAGRRPFTLIAGPCTVESREQTMTVARAVKAGGASMMRAGVWKPRTSPFSFPGLGSAGLEIVREAKAETGLPVVTELTTAEQRQRWLPRFCTGALTKLCGPSSSFSALK